MIKQLTPDVLPEKLADCEIVEQRERLETPSWRMFNVPKNPSLLRCTGAKPPRPKRNRPRNLNDAIRDLTPSRKRGVELAQNNPPPPEWFEGEEERPW